MRFVVLSVIFGLGGASKVEDFFGKGEKPTPASEWVTKVTPKPFLPDLPELPVGAICSELQSLATVDAITELCSRIGVVQATETSTTTTLTTTTTTSTSTEISTEFTTTTTTTLPAVQPPPNKRGLLDLDLTKLKGLKNDVLSSVCSCIVASTATEVITSTSTSTSTTLTTTTTTTLSVETSIVPFPCNFHYESRTFCPNTNVANRRQGAVCGGRITGTGTNAQPLFSTNPNNYIDCLNRCSREPNCAVWSFQRDLGGNTCYLYQNTQNVPGVQPVYNTDYEPYSIRGYKLGQACQADDIPATSCTSPLCTFYRDPGPVVKF